MLKGIYQLVTGGGTNNNNKAGAPAQAWGCKYKMKNRYNFNKNAKMNLLCPKARTIPALNCVYFDENCAIATDGYAMLVAPIKEISTLSGEDIEKLNGKLIDKDDYKDLLKFDLVRIESDGILGISTKTNAETKYSFKDYSYPNYKSVMNCSNCEQTQTIAFRGAHTGTMCEIMDTPFIKLQPNGTGAIRITLKDSEARGLIMPCNF